MTMRFSKCNVALTLGLIFVQHYIILGQQVSTNPCPQATDCSGCMQADPRCAWCLDDNYLAGLSKRSRCDLRSALEQPNVCNNITSTNSQSSIESNKEFDNAIQVRPEIVNVTLRPGQPARFNVSVKPAPDFPVDIYFLVDGSFSMEDDLANIQALGGAIASNISEITKNFRLGFGTFVDKEAVPFVEGPQSPNFPCNHRPSSCIAVYPYRHLLAFTNDTILFQERVGQASNELSGDSDTSEGGFDGLMQAATCEQLIGWKPQGEARRIVLLVTDALPKIAGDGQLIGGLVQNDGKCHLSPLESNNNILSYNASTTMDYPSISQLRHAMQKNAITPILAVGEKHLNIYKEIEKAWSSVLASTGELSGNSNNIVNLLRDNYQKISSLVRLIESANDNLIFNYKPLSPNCANIPNSNPNECSDINIGEEVDFEVSVTARSCPSDLANAEKSTLINIIGFGAVQINIDYLCDCECTRAAENNSPRCSKNGTLECAICKCNEGFFGDICHCDESNFRGSLNDTLLPCLQNPTDNTTVCSNQGSCICGQCVCNLEKEPERKISGPFCQCKNFGCPPHEGKECGGTDRGECVCGRCQCREEYDGNNCGQNNCTYVQEKICKKNKVICSNQGSCDCGNKRCNCDPGYDGEHCENCITNQCKCSVYQNCILCCGLGKANENCTDCEYYGIVEIADPDATCTVPINATCFAVFNYGGKNDTHNDTIYWVARCSSTLDGDSPNSLAIVLGTIAAIIFIGLLLLLLRKLLLLLQDKNSSQLMDPTFLVKDQRAQKNLQRKHLNGNFNTKGDSTAQLNDQIHQMKDERAQNILEKKHLYESFNKEDEGGKESLEQKHPYENFDEKDDSAAQLNYQIHHMKDERVQNILEKKHPYENFNEEDHSTPQINDQIHQMKGEKPQNISEKKHPYENFNKEDEGGNESLEQKHPYESLNKQCISTKQVKNHISEPEQARSRDKSKMVNLYETLTGGNNSSLAMSSLKSKEEKPQYMELTVKYRDMQPVYAKLSQ